MRMSIKNGAIVGANADATPLLRFIAQDHADRIAKVWPAPHAGFLTLPTARRHAAAMLVNNLGNNNDAPTQAIKHCVERDRDGVIAQKIMGDRTPGFAKAMAKMGEQLWSVGDYNHLLHLFREPNANQVLRHLKALTPAHVEPIAVVHPALRQARILTWITQVRAALDLNTAFELAVRLRGEGQAARIADRWGRAATRERLFEMAAEDLCPDEFRPPAPPLELGFPFERIKTRKHLHAMALEFKNCLRDFTEEVARGRMAVYALRGDNPAAIALIWDMAGWRLAEAEAPDNELLDDKVLKDVVKAVEAAGGRAGPAIQTLMGRLTGHRTNSHVHDPGSSYADRLELGDLWN